MSTTTATAVPAHSTLAIRQEWGWSPSSSTPVYGESSSLAPASSHAEQPSVVGPSVSYSYTIMPTATVPTQAQEGNIYNAPRDRFGTGVILATCGVLGAILVMLAIWAVIAHRNGRRPFACCGGGKQNNSIARGGPMESDIPFSGAGRHFDRRPVSVQPQPVTTTQPQRPRPAQYQMPRHPDADWVAVFKETK